MQATAPDHDTLYPACYHADPLHAPIVASQTLDCGRYAAALVASQTLDCGRYAAALVASQTLDCGRYAAALVA